MKSKLLFALVLLSTLFLFTRCTKEGPEGPAGKDGNANVKSSTVTFSNWTWDSGNSYMYVDFTWSAITSSIVNSGALLIYVNTTSGWAQLPRTIYPSASYSESQRFTYNVGSFRIIVQDSDFLQPTPALGTWTIKVVAIEASARKANPDLDWSNYNDVKERFNLTD